MIPDKTDIIQGRIRIAIIEGAAFLFFMASLCVFLIFASAMVP